MACGRRPPASRGPAYPAVCRRCPGRRQSGRSLVLGLWLAMWDALQRLAVEGGGRGPGADLFQQRRGPNRGPGGDLAWRCWPTEMTSAEAHLEPEAAAGREGRIPTTGREPIARW